MPIAIPGRDSRAIASLVIANGTAVSSAVHAPGHYPSAILMPAAWTAASITFQVSEDGQTWRNLFDGATEVAVASPAADHAQALTAAAFASRPAAWWRLRSGTTGSPVNQGAERTLFLILVD